MAIIVLYCTSGNQGLLVFCMATPFRATNLGRANNTPPMLSFIRLAIRFQLYSAFGASFCGVLFCFIILLESTRHVVLYTHIRQQQMSQSVLGLGLT